ncbi:MAG: hypothetical protein GX066_03155 [Clostridiaceae bacterium]|nr:hypothetical protein [Clostridiaceae bacterium]
MAIGKSRSILAWGIILLIVFKILFSYTLLDVSPFEDVGKKKVMFSAVSSEEGSLTLQVQKREQRTPIPIFKTDRMYLLVFYLMYVSCLYLVQNNGLVDIREKIRSLVGIYFQGSKYKGVVRLLFM